MSGIFLSSWKQDILNDHWKLSLNWPACLSKTKYLRQIITDKSQLQSLKIDYTVVLPHNQFITLPLVMDCWSWFLTMQFPVKEASKIVKIITLNQHHPL